MAGNSVGFGIFADDDFRLFNNNKHFCKAKRYQIL